MTSPFAGIVPALIERAQRIAAARIAERRSDQAARWRKAALLWPTFVPKTLGD